MPRSPIQRLSRAIRAITDDGKPEKVVALAREYGVDGHLGRRAASGKDVNADAYLKLCAAAGIDPMTGAKAERRRIEDLAWGLLGIKVLACLIGGWGETDLTMRAAAKKWRVSLVTVSRAKAGQPIGVDNFLALCRAMHVHPHLFLTRKPEMFHGKQAPGQAELKEAIGAQA